MTFAYRIWYLQGIGGYRTATGSPMLFNWHPVSMAQALLLRLWALLFLPVNWSIQPEIWLRIATGLMLVSLSFAAFAAYRARSSTSLHRLYAALAFTLCAAIPVFPLLLIASDLSGARVLYLPSIGIGLCSSAALVNGLQPKVSQRALTGFAFVLLFQLAALLHNQFIWKTEAAIAYQACLDVATVLKQNPSSHIYAPGMPRTRNGVFFLGNGFAECVALAAGKPITASNITLGEPPPAASAGNYVFAWRDSTAQLERIK